MDKVGNFYASTLRSLASQALLQAGKDAGSAFAMNARFTFELDGDFARLLFVETGVKGFDRDEYGRFIAADPNIVDATATTGSATEVEFVVETPAPRVRRVGVKAQKE